MPQSVPDFKLKQPAHRRGGCAVDSNRLTDKQAIHNSIIDNKGAFANLEVCGSPVTAFYDTGASVSCNSQRLSKRLPANFQNQLQPASCLVVAANQAELLVPGTVNLPISLTSNGRQQQFFVMESSEADFSLGLHFLEDNHCDVFSSSMQLRFPISQTVPLFHNRKTLSELSSEQINVTARETAFISAVHAAVILCELLTHSFLKKFEDISEPSPGFRERKTVFGLEFFL